MQVLTDYTRQSVRHPTQADRLRNRQPIEIGSSKALAVKCIAVIAALTVFPIEINVACRRSPPLETLRHTRGADYGLGAV